MNDWQPIETCPTEEMIWLAGPCYNDAAIGKMSRNRGWPIFVDGAPAMSLLSSSCLPAHWKPLERPPLPAKMAAPPREKDPNDPADGNPALDQKHDELHYIAKIQEDIRNITNVLLLQSERLDYIQDVARKLVDIEGPPDSPGNLPHDTT